uniref:PadR family transcriptional regulator n=1 Tax=Heterorhabditis bacteriophora TaxID=37862 RepID=A0A1I7WVH4_HETBA
MKPEDYQSDATTSLAENPSLTLVTLMLWRVAPSQAKIYPMLKLLRNSQRLRVVHQEGLV